MNTVVKLEHIDILPYKYFDILKCSTYVFIYCMQSIMFLKMCTRHGCVLICRYESLTEPASIRRDNLEDALLMYQYYRDVEDELTWIQEKLPVASSTDLGNSLNSVQNLMKKHQVTWFKEIEFLKS